MLTILDQSYSYFSTRDFRSIMPFFYGKRLHCNRDRNEWDPVPHDNGHHIPHCGFHSYSKHFHAHSTSRSREPNSFSSLCWLEWFRRNFDRQRHCHAVRANRDTSISQSQTNSSWQLDRHRHQAWTDSRSLHPKHNGDIRSVNSLCNNYPHRSRLQDSANSGNRDCSSRNRRHIDDYGERPQWILWNPGSLRLVLSTLGSNVQHVSHKHWFEHDRYKW